MFSTIYIEEEVLELERVRNLLDRFAQVPQVICGRYGEVFNRKSQNFRLQKMAPILTIKYLWATNRVIINARFGSKADSQI